MKVALATQTLSSSVATAIEIFHCSGSEAKCQFLRCFDILFDICKNSSVRPKGYKSPLTSFNFQQKCHVMAEGIGYFQSLTDASGRLLTLGKRKTGLGIGYISL